MGVWVDTVHALTALGLAAIDRRRIRAGLANTAIAAVWAAAGYRDLTIARATPPQHQRIRDQLAEVVLARVPAGSFLRQKVDDARHRLDPIALENHWRIVVTDADIENQARHVALSVQAFYHEVTLNGLPCVRQWEEPAHHDT